MSLPNEVSLIDLLEFYFHNFIISKKSPNQGLSDKEKWKKSANQNFFDVENGNT